MNSSYEIRKVSEKVDKNVAAVEYMLSIVADVENVTALAADYIAFYTNFKIKYGIEDEEKVKADELESKIEEQDIITLTNKAYSIKANLIKLYPKIKALAEIVGYDTKNLDEVYQNIKKNVIIKDVWVEEILFHINIMIQGILLSGVFDIVKRWGAITSIEKA